MANEISQIDLARLRDWANGQLGYGSKLPWSAFLLRRLVETIDALLTGLAATQAEAARKSASCRQPAPRLVVSNASRDGDRGPRSPLRSHASQHPLTGEKSKSQVIEPLT
jgi:hypothetical protein